MTETAAEQALAPVRGMEALTQSPNQEISREAQSFELLQRKANVYAQSTLVPERYRGNVGNVIIAMNMSNRLGADLLMVMQNLYVVHGSPGWSAQFLIATFNANGRFSAIKYRFRGEQGSEDWGCQAYCTESSTGEELTGTWVTWQMAVSEQWSTKTGSKWKTMPEQMFRYRAATFLIRTTAPEIAMGLLTKEELEDIDGPIGNGNSSNLAQATQRRAADLRDQLSQEDLVSQEADVDAEIILDETPTVTEEEAKDIAENVVSNLVTAPDIDVKQDGDSITFETKVETADRAESQAADLLAAASEKYADAKKNDRDLMHKMNEFIGGGKLLKDLSPDELTAFIDTF